MTMSKRQLPSSDHDQRNGQHPSSSSDLEDAMDRIMGVASSAAAAPTAVFLPSPSWQGSKLGYYFGTGSQGTGYYLDDHYHHGSNNSHHQLTKRPRLAGDNDDGEQEPRSAAAVRFQEDRNQIHRYTGEELLQLAEQQQLQQQQQQQTKSSLHTTTATSQLFLDFSNKGLQQATMTLSKWHVQNSLQRVEYADDPHMYMDSEVQLQQAIIVWKGLAAQPKWFSTLLQQISTNSNNHNNNNKTSSTTPVLSSLQQLLVHENADIAVSVISVIGDWLDPQVIEDVDEDDEAEGGGAQDEVASHLFRLAYWLVVQSGDSHNNTDDSSSSSNPSGWDYIVSNLGRLSIEDDDDDVVVDGEENEDFQGVQTILNLTEQLLELDVLRLATAAADVTEGGSPMRIPPSWVPYMMKQSSSSLLSWLLGLLHDALEKTDSDTNPIVGRALEILSSLAQREEIYTVHPDWTHLPTFRSMFDDEEEEHGDNKPMAKKQKKNPNGDDNDSSSPTKEELNGIEIMLQMIAPFRKRNPSTDTQLDWLENTCLTLASALTFSPIHHLPYFLEAQGIELILRCLKEQVHAGGVGLKLLDFHLPVSTATSSAKAQELDSQAQCACEHLVKAGGFKFVFPLFMGRSLPRRAQIGPSDAAATSTASKRQEREWNQMIQDQIIRILYALSRYLTDASPDDAKARFLSKFVEAGMEKCDRLVDLTLRYDQKTRQAEYRFYRNTDVDNDDEEEEMDDTAALQAKLQGGGDLFYCLCAICAFCCVGSKRCHERIVEQLESRQSGLSLIQTGLQEFVSVLDDGSQKAQVQFYLTSLF